MAKYKTGADAKFADSAAVPNEETDDENPEGNEEEEEKDKPPKLEAPPKQGPYWERHRLFEITKEEDDVIHTAAPFALDKRPLCAIQPSIQPIDVANNIDYNEFGYRLDEPSTSCEFQDNDAHKMRWWAALEAVSTSSSSRETGELRWSGLDLDRLRNDDKIQSLVREIGVPHSMRPFLWARLCGAISKRDQAGYGYADVVRQSRQDKPSVGVQIEHDLLRVLPANVCFHKKESPGIEALRRLLKAVAYMFPDLGYCQGMGVVGAHLLLFCPEETAFWCMVSLVEDILPPNYYSSSLLGLQADERVARQLMSTQVPELYQLCEENGVELSLLLINWLLTLFASTMPTKSLLRVWDLLFTFGSISLFRVLMSIFKLREDDAVTIFRQDLESQNQKQRGKDSSAIYGFLASLPMHADDPERLVQYSASFDYSITPHLLSELRKKQQAILMADQGLITINGNFGADVNLPKQKAMRRKVARSKSIIQQLFSKDKNSENEAPHAKNIRQTEMLVDLKDAVFQICRYFMNNDGSGEMSVSTQPDYSPESHEKDLEIYLRARRVGLKRAKALLDFERQDEDELGFKKNDIITVVAEKDDHCWIGELNGLRGWFPAKFVEVIDERGKNYTIWGDEAVSPEITDYVRGRLANAFRQIMEHGLRESSLPGAPAHAWHFVEEIAQKSVAAQFNAVYSRLTLCNTFQLDQEVKILTPCELLFQTVQSIDESHRAVRAPNDVKLRSLLAAALNNQCLHLWFELVCSGSQGESSRMKYYHSWAFIRSPAWRQIKCELRVLAQFAFSLGLNSELADYDLAKRKNTAASALLNSVRRRAIVPIPSDKIAATAAANAAVNVATNKADSPLKEGVQDMLVKHHLFSWDL